LTSSILQVVSMQDIPEKESVKKDQDTLSQGVLVFRCCQSYSQVKGCKSQINISYLGVIGINNPVNSHINL